MESERAREGWRKGKGGMAEGLAMESEKAREGE